MDEALFNQVRPIDQFLDEIQIAIEPIQCPWQDAIVTGTLNKQTACALCARFVHSGFGKNETGEKTRKSISYCFY